MIVNDYRSFAKVDSFRIPRRRFEPRFVPATWLRRRTVRLYLQAPSWYFRHSPPLSVYPVKGKREGSRARAHLSACVSACCACDCVCNLCGLAWSVLVSSQWSAVSRCLFVVLSSLASWSSAVTSLCSTCENENPRNAEITREFACCVDWILLGAREYGRIRGESETGAPWHVKNFDFLSLSLSLSRDKLFSTRITSRWCSSALFESIETRRIRQFDISVSHFFPVLDWSGDTRRINATLPKVKIPAIFSLLSARERN